MIQKNYSDIRQTLRTGDLVAFGGQTFISASIKAITKSNISHVGMVMKVNTNQAKLPIIMIVESTSLGNGFSGVHISRLSTRLKGYQGDIWILPIDGAINIAGTETFLVSSLGVEYDYKQAIGSALDSSFSADQTKDLSRLFCSELCNEVYAQNLLANADAVPLNSSEQTPIDVCLLPIYREVYQVVGSPKELQ